MVNIFGQHAVLAELVANQCAVCDKNWVILASATEVLSCSGLSEPQRTPSGHSETPVLDLFGFVYTQQSPTSSVTIPVLYILSSPDTCTEVILAFDKGCVKSGLQYSRH